MSDGIDPHDLEVLKARADAVAARLGTAIPNDIRIESWLVPLLEKIVERLERLEGPITGRK